MISEVFILLIGGDHHWKTLKSPDLPESLTIDHGKDNESPRYLRMRKTLDHKFKCYHIYMKDPKQ